MEVKNIHHQQTNIHFFTDRMGLFSLSQQSYSTEGKNITFDGLSHPKLNWGSSYFVSGRWWNFHGCWRSAATFPICRNRYSCGPHESQRKPQFLSSSRSNMIETSMTKKSLRVLYHTMANTCSSQYMYQIQSFYLKPFKWYRGGSNNLKWVTWPKTCKKNK